MALIDRRLHPRDKADVISRSADPTPWLEHRLTISSKLTSPKEIFSASASVEAGWYVVPFELRGFFDLQEEFFLFCFFISLLSATMADGVAVGMADGVADGVADGGVKKKGVSAANSE